MSTPQPVSATSRVRLPQPPLALWGYDRRFVDARLAELAEQLEQERQRRAQAERALQQLRLELKEDRAQVPAWFTNVGTEVDRVLEEAGTAAAKLLAATGRRVQEAIDQAEAQAADRLKAAEEQKGQLEQAARETLADAQAERARIEAATTKAAEEKRAQADRDASALLAKANDEARRALDQAARERRLLEAESQHLTTLREAMVQQLVKVYAPLGLTLVDTRGELQPPAPDGLRAEPEEPNPAATVEASADDGKQPLWRELWAERGGEAS
ncbi:MAG TPA: hypothetical protein VG276_23975 [Actinomycetes bacterium]|nr:hypothetical protein [Actinomycetes bacterium]